MVLTDSLVPAKFLDHIKAKPVAAKVLNLEPHVDVNALNFD